MIFREKKRREPQLIIVSLIDVVLQLVIFLLLTTTFEGREVSFGIDLPGAETGSSTERSALTVDVGPGGEVSIGGEAIQPDNLARLFRNESEAAVGGSVTIRADRLARHGDVVRIVDLARKSDLDRLSIAVAASSGGAGGGAGRE